MKEEVLKLWLPDKQLQQQHGNTIRLIDGTIGLGGHTLAAINSIQQNIGGEEGETNINLNVLGIDRDKTALDWAKKLLAKEHHFDSHETAEWVNDDEVEEDDEDDESKQSTSSESTSPYQINFHHGSFKEISPSLLTQHHYSTSTIHPPPPKVHGILLDCYGPNSFALTSPDRGHTYLKQGPLDMRYDATTPDKHNMAKRVRNIVNHHSYSELLAILQTHAPDEPYGDDIAAAIVQWRLDEKTKKRGPKGIRSTLELRYIIEEAVDELVPRSRNNLKQKQKFRQLKAIWRPPKKEATMARKKEMIRKFEERKVKYGEHTERVFRALRMEANGDLDHLGSIFENDGVEQSLETGGRLVVITYHSIEDGLVRRGMEEMVDSGRYKMVTPEEDGIRPSKEEVEVNERSKDAMLRAVELVR